MSGDAGFDRPRSTVPPAAGDAFKLAPDGADAVFRRTNLVPFTIELDPDTEAVAANGGAGNDTVASPGLGRMFVAADGGSGNDAYRRRGSGHVPRRLRERRVGPGSGSDLADGGNDDDLLLTRDDTGDLVRGGPGNDSAETDSIHVDQTTGVEELDATPLPSRPRRPTRRRSCRRSARCGEGQGPQAHRPRATHLPGGRGGRLPDDGDVGDRPGDPPRAGARPAPARNGHGRPRAGPVRHRRGATRSRHGRPREARDAPARLRVFSADAAGNLVAGRATVDLRIPNR